MPLSECLSQHRRCLLLTQAIRERYLHCYQELKIGKINLYFVFQKFLPRFFLPPSNPVSQNSIHKYPLQLNRQTLSTLPAVMTFSCTYLWPQIQKPMVRIHSTMQELFNSHRSTAILPSRFAFILWKPPRELFH